MNLSNLTALMFVAVIGFFLASYIENDTLVAQLSIGIAFLVNIAAIAVNSLHRIKHKLQGLSASFLMGSFIGVCLLQA